MVLRISTHNHLTENYLNLFQNVLTKDFFSPHKSQGNGSHILGNTRDPTP